MCARPIRRGRGRTEPAPGRERALPSTRRESGGCGTRDAGPHGTARRTDPGGSEGPATPSCRVGRARFPGRRACRDARAGKGSAPQGSGIRDWRPRTASPGRPGGGTSSGQRTGRSGREPPFPTSRAVAIPEAPAGEGFRRGSARDPGTGMAASGALPAPSTECDPVAPIRAALSSGRNPAGGSRAGRAALSRRSGPAGRR